jgi:hypothetical protein
LRSRYLDDIFNAQGWQYALSRDARFNASRLIDVRIELIEFLIVGFEFKGLGIRFIDRDYGGGSGLGIHKRRRTSVLAAG